MVSSHSRSGYFPDYDQTVSEFELCCKAILLKHMSSILGFILFDDIWSQTGHPVSNITSAFFLWLQVTQLEATKIGSQPGDCTMHMATYLPTGFEFMSNARL